MLRAFPLCTCCRHYPGTVTGGTALLISPSPISLPRNGGQVGLCIGIFEDCSAFTHVTACTHAGSSKMTRYIRGFSHFVTSMTAPIASGWSKIAGWDSHPLENAAFARRTPSIAVPELFLKGVNATPDVPHPATLVIPCALFNP